MFALHLSEFKFTFTGVLLQTYDKRFLKFEKYSLLDFLIKKKFCLTRTNVLRIRRRRKSLLANNSAHYQDLSR